MFKELSVVVSGYWSLFQKGELDIHDSKLLEALKETIAALGSGELRVAEKNSSQWEVNQWVKQAILLSFRTAKSELMSIQTTTGAVNWFDKVPLLTSTWSGDDFSKSGIRSVPGSYVRHGAYVGKNCVLMPSFVNIGAFVNNGTMVDIWATVGSCAQIGKNCHISANVCIGGVLEPLNANPVIIEDDCFIGTGSCIVEGVVIEEGSIISMGVSIGSSTKIIDRDTGETMYGKVPANSVVVPGNVVSSKYPDVTLSAAIIVKKVDRKSRDKTALNEILRDLE